MTTRSTVRLSTLAVGAVIALAVLTTGCKKYTAENDGQSLGEAICDLKHSEGREGTKTAAENVKTQLHDIETKYSVWTPAGREVMDKTLENLRTHAEERNWAEAHKDLSALHQELSLAKKSVTEIGEATIDGIHQGLDGCTSE